MLNDNPNDNSENIKNNWGVKNYCKKKNMNYCIIVNQTLDILITININIKENDTNLLMKNREKKNVYQQYNFFFILIDLF
jgi:hypothetical protein